MSTKKTTLLAFGLLALSALPAVGQAHPNRTKGFDPRGTYSIGEVDSVNLFNGALTVTIPLGPRYPVGSSDYGFALVYNSNAWTVREVCPQLGSTGPVSFSSSLRTECSLVYGHVRCITYGVSGAWTTPGDDYDPRPAPDCHNLSLPNPTTNAGLGWQLNLGKLLPAMATNDDRSPFVVEGGRWNYAGGDGSLHALSPGSDGAFYSRDGSYLRLKACTPARATCWEVNLPDGSVEVHEEFGIEWRLTHRKDAFGNGFTIAYTDPHPNHPTDPSSWLIEDSQNRKHLVALEQPSLDFPRRIVSLLLDSTGPRPLSIALVHTPQVLDRAAPHNDIGIGGPPVAARIPAQLLTSLDFKSGGQLLSQWSFGGYQIDQPGTARVNGVMTTMKMPTGATVAWSFGGEYRYPSGASGRGHLRSTVGVLSRTVTDVTGTEIGTWTYTPELEQRPADEDCNLGGNIPWLPKCHEKEFTNTVRQPGGYRTKHYFSVYPLPPYFDDDETPDSEKWDGVDYGLPFTRRETTPITAAGIELFLSSETFASEGAAEPVRRSYVRYERDEAPPLPPGTPPEVVANWDGFHSELLNSERVSARAEVFEDDPAGGGKMHWRLTKYERWDGKGHYRDEIVRSSFSGEVDRSRKTTTEYTDTRPALHQKWFLGQFTEVVTQDFGSSAVLAKQVRQVCFDGATPFISRTRTLAGNSAGPDDVLAVFTRNSLGQVTEERLFGGDGARLDTGNLCSDVSLTGPPTSWVVHSYQHGVRSKSVVKEPCSGTDVVTLLDQTIDPSGVPTSVRDASGTAVTLAYDALGRRTSEQPDTGEGARTEYEYKLPSIGGHGATTEAQVIVRRRAGEQGAQLAVSQVHFDGLGRAIADATWTPTPTGEVGVPLSVSKLSAQGWPLKVSMPRCGAQNADFTQACNSGANSPEASLEALGFPADHQGVTRYELHDPFGRPGRVVAPDGFVSTADYTGVRVVARTVKVGTGVGVLSNASRTEEYDFLGRLAAVTEPSGVNGAAVKTTYTYDVGDRLVEVSTNSAGTTQQRSFEYDGRGFLLSETHPELGQYGNGTKKYSGYDARGLAGSATILLEGGYPDGDRLLDFRYDAAGRLIEVQHGSRPLEQYFYAWENGPEGRSAGKIVEARRFNTGSGVTVAETYKYAGRAGRVSERTTRTSLGHQFKIAATYNLLGDVETVTYPTCTGLAGCEAVSDPRTVSYGYQLGFLHSISSVSGQVPQTTAWLTGTEYSPSGRWRKLTRGNDTIDEQVGDPSGLGRPKEYKVYNEDGLLWETGAGGYTYDGAGNITGMGPERFTYDKVSRLTSGTVKKLPLALATGASETLSYDAFGNLLTRAVTGTPPTPTPLVHPDTNRLSLGTYDVNGNLRRYEEIGLTVSHHFDALNTLLSTTQNGQTTHYLYAPGGERLATLRPGGVTSWTLRGFGNEVLRVFEQDAGDTWRHQRDHIYRGGQLLASDAPAPEGIAHYHLDHLGSTRLVTGPNGEYRAFHAYLPFGEEVTAPAASATKLKYTGHEREEGLDSVSRADDLDYMHARWCSPEAGRFLSVDPVLGRVGAPQSWNRYSYVANNPIQAVDPRGLNSIKTTDETGTFTVSLAGNGGRIEYEVELQVTERFATEYDDNGSVVQRTRTGVAGVATNTGNGQASFSQAQLAVIADSARLIFLNTHGGNDATVGVAVGIKESHLGAFSGPSLGPFPPALNPLQLSGSSGFRPTGDKNRNIDIALNKILYPFLDAYQLVGGLERYNGAAHRIQYARDVIGFHNQLSSSARYSSGTVRTIDVPIQPRNIRP